MGTAEDEAKARDDLERVKTENLLKQQEQDRALEEYRKQQEQNKMVADEPAVANWPDDGFQATPQSGMDRVAGALRVGQAGDVAFARDLLNSGQAPLGSLSTADQAADGAKESAVGSRTAKPALGLG
jgi:hypothetical protein